MSAPTSELDETRSRPWKKYNMPDVPLWLWVEDYGTLVNVRDLKKGTTYVMGRGYGTVPSFVTPEEDFSTAFERDGRGVVTTVDEVTVKRLAIPSSYQPAPPSKGFYNVPQLRSTVQRAAVPRTLMAVSKRGIGLPADIEARIGEMSSGVPGSLKTQLATLKKTAGRRTRKTNSKRSRRTRRIR